MKGLDARRSDKIIRSTWVSRLCCLVLRQRQLGERHLLFTARSTDAPHQTTKSLRYTLNEQKDNGDVFPILFEALATGVLWAHPIDDGVPTKGTPGQSLEHRLSHLQTGAVTKKERLKAFMSSSAPAKSWPVSRRAGNCRCGCGGAVLQSSLQAPSRWFLHFLLLKGR